MKLVYGSDICQMNIIIYQFTKATHCFLLYGQCLNKNLKVLGVLSWSLGKGEKIVMSRIEDDICDKIQERAALGLKKYGTTLERTDLNRLDWLTHLQEELMDAVGYLEVLIQKEQTTNTQK